MAGKTIVVASGKGGTGKTMFTANIGASLAMRGHRVCVVDMDTGLRNLDLYLGLEDKVVYDVNDVLNGVCRIKQAIIKHKTFPGLSFIAASPKPDEGEITPLHIKVLCNKLKTVFDYVIVDAPAGCDDGFQVAMGGADELILMITPEFASIRDAEAVNLIMKKQIQIAQDEGLYFPVPSIHYVLNKVDVQLVKAGMEMSLEEMPAGLRRNIIGIIKDDKNIHISTLLGTPIVFKPGTSIQQNFERIAERIEKL